MVGQFRGRSNGGPRSPDVAGEQACGWPPLVAKNTANMSVVGTVLLLDRRETLISTRMRVYTAAGIGEFDGRDHNCWPCALCALAPGRRPITVKLAVYQALRTSRN